MRESVRKNSFHLFNLKISSKISNEASGGSITPFKYNLGVLMWWYVGN